MRDRLASFGIVGMLATACGGFPERTFIEEYEPLFCQTYALCATPEMLRTVNARECLQHLRQQDYPSPPECLYRSEFAEACLDLLAEGGCVGNDPEFPDECNEVYSRCPLPRVPPERGPGR